MITVARASGCTNFSFSVDIYSFVTGTGATNQDVGTNGGGPASDTLTMIIQPNSFIYEAFSSGNGAANCPTFSGNSGQAIRDTFTCFVTGGNRQAGTTEDRQYASGGSTPSTMSFANGGGGGQPNTWSHLTVELLAAGGSITSLTQCYGACGNPAITLVNTNATHTINFNQSFTIFYEFQSGINGVLLNVTTNVAKTYANSQNVALGVYTASCGAGQAPFTTACGGLLQSSTQRANPVKGRFALTVPVTVSSGEWIGLAVSATLSGLDLNNTNAGCGISGDGGICVNPPGMSFTTGILPSIISTSAACTANGSPCNTAGISTTGLWAWINGNVIGATPPQNAACTNNFAQLDCMLPALSNGMCMVVTASCQTSGSLFWIALLTVVSFLLVTVGFASANVTKFVAAGDVFLFFFLTFFFMFAGVGLLETFVVIFFLFLGATVFGKTARNYF
ncbi:MAG TPA: hypothetical protein VF910_07725 [Candidatus Bathyarchaeia archaeon]